MMETANAPEGLKPYLSHGVDLKWRKNTVNATGECPFCGGDRFQVKVKTSEFDCFNCTEDLAEALKEKLGTKGKNSTSFIRLLWLLSYDLTTLKEYKAFGETRGLQADTLIRWEVAKSRTNDNWMVPGYTLDRKLGQLYQYKQLKDGLVLLPTPGLYKAGQVHKLHGLNLYDPEKPIVYLCEGPWDGMALWETLNCLNMLSEVNVLASPGCKIFPQSWSKFFKGKTVNLLFDNDHPKQNKKTGKLRKPDGFAGVQRVAKILGNGTLETNYLRWGEGGFTPDLPSGYDVRDLLIGGPHGKGDYKPPETRKKAFGALKAMLHPAPKAGPQNEGTEAGSGAPERVVLALRKCTSYQRLRVAWRKALKWTPGLDKTLIVMLAGIASTSLVGDQLWIKVIGPASCGKSELCEAVSTNLEYVYPKSTLRGFHSGYKEDGSSTEGEDNSLLYEALGKTLVTKDGDTLLQAPNLQQILAEARDIYDGTSRTHYRNKMGKDYMGIRMTWILAGTSSLRSIDESELGERFLDCVISEGKPDTTVEKLINLRVAARSLANTSIEATDDPESYHEPAKTKAMQMTGGYVSYLRETMASTKINMTSQDLEFFSNLGLFVANLRARPSTRQEETAERELSFRLTSQLVRLATCVCHVLNKTRVTTKVRRIISEVAKDTARGNTYKLVQAMHRYGEVEVQALRVCLGKSEYKVRELLQFMREIGICNSVTRKHGRSTTRKWYLTEEFKTLCLDTKTL